MDFSLTVHVDGIGGYSRRTSQFSELRLLIFEVIGFEKTIFYIIFRKTLFETELSTRKRRHIRYATSTVSVSCK